MTQLVVGWTRSSQGRCDICSSADSCCLLPMKAQTLYTLESQRLRNGLRCGRKDGHLAYDGVALVVSSKKRAKIGIQGMNS